MRHGKKINHLGRTTPHRKAMLSNMASSLILHKRISTTVPKAKALRKYVEPLITKSKSDSTHSRRTIFSYLQNKESVNALFDDVADKVATRPGGYTRIIKTGNRLGDNAEMCIIELVDYNDLLLKETESKTKTRRSRRGGKKNKAAAQTKDKAESTTAAPEQKVENVEEATTDAVEEKKEQSKEEESQKASEASAEVKDETKAESKSDADAPKEKKDDNEKEEGTSDSDSEDEKK